MRGEIYTIDEGLMYKKWKILGWFIYRAEFISGGINIERLIKVNLFKVFI